MNLQVLPNVAELMSCLFKILGVSGSDVVRGSTQSVPVNLKLQLLISASNRVKVQNLVTARVPVVIAIVCLSKT